jgi:SAM-dependent methyltransferase
MVEKTASRTIQSFDYQWKYLPEGDNLLSDRNWRENVDKFILDELRMTRGEIKGKTVLDAGCGQGRWSYGFAKLGARVWGIDTSASAVNYANEHLGRATPPPHFCVASVLNEKKLSEVLNNTTFDIIWCWGVLHHTGDPERGFVNLVKLLKKGGTIHLYLYGKKSPATKFWRRFFAVFPFKKRESIANYMAKFERLIHRLKPGFFSQAMKRVFPFSISAHTNFDSYSPSIASSHTEGEVRRWFEKRGLTFWRYSPKRIGRYRTNDLFVSGVKK